MAKQKFKIGDQIGVLTLKERLPELDKWSNPTWLCVCSCGTERTIYSSNLKPTTRCYCLGSIGVGEMPGGYWSSVLRCAKQRNIPVEMTKEEAWEVYVHQDGKCALTDLPLTFKSEKKNRCHGTASLDRKDSMKPYTADNVWWVHKDINIMKNDFTTYEFIEWCTKVAKKWDSSGIRVG